MQHEFDHLNGKLYVDRLDDKQSRKARKMIKGNGWGTARAQLDAGRRPRPVRTRRPLIRSSDDHDL
jgi:peptide deformylase